MQEPAGSHLSLGGISTNNEGADRSLKAGFFSCLIVSHIFVSRDRNCFFYSVKSSFSNLNFHSNNIQKIKIKKKDSLLRKLAESLFTT